MPAGGVRTRSVLPIRAVRGEEVCRDIRAVVEGSVKLAVVIFIHFKFHILAIIVVVDMGGLIAVYIHHNTFGGIGKRRQRVFVVSRGAFATRCKHGEGGNGVKGYRIIADIVKVYGG